MKTLFKLLGLCLITVISVSCEKINFPCDPTKENSPCYQGPEEPQEPQLGDTLLIAEYTRATQYGKSTYKNIYDDDNRLLKTTQYRANQEIIQIDEYAYNEKGQVLTRAVKDKNGRITHLDEYIYYDTDIRPAGMVQTMPIDPNDTPFDWSFGYYNNEFVQSAHPRGELTGGFTDTFIYNNDGDIVSLSSVDFDEGGNYFKEERSNFDGKVRANKYGNPYGWRTTGSQNHQHSLIAVSLDESENQLREYKYTYNNAGYPLKTEVYNQTTGELLETYEYTYQAAN